MSDENTIEGEATEVADSTLAEALGQINGPEQATEQQQAEQEAPMNQQEEMAVVMFTAGQILAMKYPSLAAVFALDKCRTVAAQINPLFEYYGWKFTLTGVVGLWLNSLGALVMLGMEVRAAVMQDMAEALRKAAEQQQTEPTPAGAE